MLVKSWCSQHVAFSPLFLVSPGRIHVFFDTTNGVPKSEIFKFFSLVALKTKPQTKIPLKPSLQNKLKMY